MPKSSSISKVAAEPEEALRQRLDIVTKGLRLGTWEWDVKTGECVFDEGWKRERQRR